MPTMTPSTMTLMPDDTTLPSTRSARKLVRFQSENGTRMKPAKEVSLNSMIVTNICTARMKKVMITIAQANSSTRSEEHTSELQSLMRISYAVFCLKKKTSHLNYHSSTHYSTSLH